MNQDLIDKIKEANLLGRGGAGFAVHLKWEAMKQNADGGKVYIIANGSEGEPAVFKDEYILKKYPEEFIEGICLALDFFQNSEAIIYLNHNYYDKYLARLSKFSEGKPIKFFRKTARYIAGDETALLSHIEGKRDEPRSKPPYPAEKGLFGRPTLINNIETFYRVNQIAKGKYEGKTFYSISGDVPHQGVFDVSLSETVENVLKNTKNYPRGDFFVQYGGGAAGAIYLPNELKTTLLGAASIIVYDIKKTNLNKLMKKWAEFYAAENCDKCTPCREGSNRILEIVRNGKLNYANLDEIFSALNDSAFCPLGRGMATPYKTLIDKVIKNGKL